MSDLASKLRDALRDSEGLATATDELTEEIALLEREVSELRLGVSESVLIGDEGSRCPLWFRKEGKTWRFVVVTGNNAIPLINASRELRLIAVDFLPELITKLVVSSRSRVSHVRDKALTVRTLRDSLKAVVAFPNPPTEEETTALDLTAEYVHNLKVRYDGLLELVRNENEALHRTVREARKAYGDLFDVCESVLHKVRYTIPVTEPGFTHLKWEVDQFYDIGLNNLWLAEIELSSPDENFPRPAWLGKEVSDDVSYTNVSLAETHTTPEP